MFAKWSTPIQNTAHGKLIVTIVGVILALGLGILGGYLGNKFNHEKYGKKTDYILGFLGLGLLCFEIFKQVFVSIDNGGYPINYIPLQICSLAEYLLLLMFFAKNKIVRSVALGFVSFFALLGGVMYFVSPTSAIVTPFIVITFHAIIWHSTLVFTGIFTISAYKLADLKKWPVLLSGYTFWIAMSLVAIVLNETVLKDFVINNNANPSLSHEYGIFYISRFAEPFYPVLKIFYPKHVLSTGLYVVYYFSFLIYFGLGGCLMLTLSWAVKLFINKVLFRKHTEQA